MRLFSNKYARNFRRVLFEHKHLMSQYSYQPVRSEVYAEEPWHQQQPSTISKWIGPLVFGLLLLIAIGIVVWLTVSGNATAATTPTSGNGGQIQSPVKPASDLVAGGIEASDGPPADYAVKREACKPGKWLYLPDSSEPGSNYLCEECVPGYGPPLEESIIGGPLPCALEVDADGVVCMYASTKAPTRMKLLLNSNPAVTSPADNDSICGPENADADWVYVTSFLVSLKPKPGTVAYCVRKSTNTDEEPLRWSVSRGTVCHDKGRWEQAFVFYAYRRSHIGLRRMCLQQALPEPVTDQNRAEYEAQKQRIQSMYGKPVKTWDNVERSFILPDSEECVGTQSALIKSDDTFLAAPFSTTSSGSHSEATAAAVERFAFKEHFYVRNVPPTVTDT